MSNAAEKLELPQPYAGELVELNEAEQQLADLRAKYGTVPDYSTEDGYIAGKKAIQVLTKMRTGTDRARLAITKPHREFIDQVNHYAKSLIGEVEQLEQPHRDAKREVDEAEQRKKEERIARLREKLSKEITAFLDTAIGLGAAGLSDLIDAAEKIDTESYYDVTKEAEEEKARVLQRLNDMHDTAVREESLAAEREQLQRERQELERLKAGAAAQATPEPDKSEAKNEWGTESMATVSQPTMPSWLAKHAEADDTEATPYENAMEDLGAVGLSVTQAADVLAAIQTGNIRNVTFNGE